MRRHWHYANSLYTQEELCHKVNLYLANIDLFPSYLGQCPLKIKHFILQGFMSDL